MGERQAGADNRDHATAKQRLDDATAKLRRHQAAIEAGVNPAALVDVMNEAQRERDAAQSALQATPETSRITEAEAFAMIDSLGDVGQQLSKARPARLAELYERLNLQMLYQPDEQAVDVAISPRVGNECVRGGVAD